MLEKTLESTLDSRTNQSILKEITPEYSLEGLMMKLKLQYFDNLMWKADSLEKTLMLGKIEGTRRRWQRMRWLDGITNSMWTWVWVSSRSWWRTGSPGMLQPMGLQRVGHDLATNNNKKALPSSLVSWARVPHPCIRNPENRTAWAGLSLTPQEALHLGAGKQTAQSKLLMPDAASDDHTAWHYQKFPF